MFWLFQWQYLFLWDMVSEHSPGRPRTRDSSASPPKCWGYRSFFTMTWSFRHIVVIQSIIAGRVCVKLLAFGASKQRKGAWEQKKLPSKSGACDPRPPIRPHLSIPSNFKSINGLIHWVSAPLWCSSFWKAPPLTKCRPMQEPLEGTEGAQIQRRPFMLLLAVRSRGPKARPSHRLSNAKLGLQLPLP